MTQSGAPPLKKPWPDDDRLDHQLLAEGDSRNVDDRYRYWTVEAIREDMKQKSVSLEIAIENVERDFNMGTIVRNANAFNVRRLHVIGRRQWNKRGAMKTDAYLDIVYHASVDEFLAATADKTLICIDNITGASSLHQADLPENALLIFGGEGPGISQELLGKTSRHIAITQLGSTRSINVGVASGILMYKWVERHILLKI